jgi:WbqC-like protein family
MTTVVVLQSNYLPWRGYFDLIHDCDLFVFYDCVQYTRQDWRNRNKIKTSAGTQWITVPVGTDLDRLIHDVTIPSAAWQAKHWQSLVQNYGKCPHFARYRPYFEDVYLGRTWQSLSELNQSLVAHIATEFLSLKTQLVDSRQYQANGQRLDRLLDVLTKAGASRYISGPAAREYIDPAAFEQAGIELAWKDYSGYPEYRQRYAPFEPGVSIIDLLFNVGPDAPWYIWGWRDGSRAPHA